MERTVFDPLCMWIGLRGLICLTPEPVWGLLAQLVNRVERSAELKPLLGSAGGPPLAGGGCR